MVRMLGLALCAWVGLVVGAGAANAATTYTNPVSQDFADTFADPSVIRAKDGYWYAFATADPLREGESDRHLLPIARSADLVHWTHVGDVFMPGNRPLWADPNALFWAPDIRYHNGAYYLYYAVTQTTVTPEPNDSAIGVATAPTPAGPWKDSGAPVVAPRRASGVPGDFQATIDPAAFTDVDGTRYLYYGSFHGGIMVTELSPDGLKAIGEPTKVTIDNRYEAAYPIRHGDAYYLFASSSGCCAGPTTGYSVFVGRALSPRGPFVDRHGQSMLASRTGGTLVLAPNGNRWVGTGHNAVTTDLSGQTWFLYHGIDRKDPYLNEPFGINERPLLLDRLDWVDGWPTLRGGRGASEKPQPAPVTREAVSDDFNDDDSVGKTRLPTGKEEWTPSSLLVGFTGTAAHGGVAGADTLGAARLYPPRQGSAPDPEAGVLDQRFSDEFEDGLLDLAWSWIRSPDGQETGGVYRWPTQDADLHLGRNSASVLLRDAPTGAYMVETKLMIDLGVDTVRSGQAGLIVYGSDDHYLRFTHTAIGNTRWAEYGKEMPFSDGLVTGSMAIGRPAHTTWLRLAHRLDPVSDEHEFRAGVSLDGRTWDWGGVWTIPSGAHPRIGLISMSGSGATARFDYVRVFVPEESLEERAESVDSS
jgi:arabinan endo-1,5-alpha-L-arabinosidase